MRATSTSVLFSPRRLLIAAGLAALVIRAAAAIASREFESRVRDPWPAHQAQTGFKSWVLKPFDALFRNKGAGTLIALHLRGTADKPDLGLDVGKTLNPK